MQSMPVAFGRELESAGLSFSLPQGFSFVEPRQNNQLSYDCAIAPSSADLEIRYHIVPLRRRSMPSDYTAVASVDLNQLCVPNMLAMIHNIGSKTIVEPNPLPRDAVSSEFGADWGAVCRLTLAPSEFANPYSECMLLALHRRDMADAYVLFMSKDMNSVGDLVQRHFYTLKFIT